MARLDTTHELFVIAGTLAKTPDEAAVLETELALETLYQVRKSRSMARRRTTDCSRYASPKLQHIAGWN